MADPRPPLRKSPIEILDDLMNGRREALFSGAETAEKYLLKFRERNDSLPNAVSFFLYDPRVVEAAHQTGDVETCRAAAAEAGAYLPVAQADMLQRFRAYSPSIRLFERGIALAIDEGDFDRRRALCNTAVALGSEPAYEAKRASIERMMSGMAMAVRKEKRRCASHACPQVAAEHRRLI